MCFYMHTWKKNLKYEFKFINVLFLNFNYIKLKISIKNWFLKRHLDLNTEIIFQKYLCQPRPLARMVALMLLGVTTAFNIPIHPFPPTNVDSNNFESIIFILQNPQKDIRIKIYLSIFSLITKTTSTNPSQFPYSPLSRHCYNQWWGRPKRMQKWFKRKWSQATVRNPEKEMLLSSNVYLETPWRDQTARFEYKLTNQ